MLPPQRMTLSRRIKITNSIETDLPIDSILLTGPAPEDFVLQKDFCSGSTLPPSGNCTVDVSFSPTSIGIRSAYATISSNTPKSWALDVPLTGIGELGPLSVTLLSPNGGEVVSSGSTWEIGWGAPSQAVKFKLQYSTDNGATWKTIGTNLSGMTYKWTVPPLQNNKKTCRVKVTGYKASGSKVGADQSDSSFTIEVVRLTAPTDPGTSFLSRETCNITWTIHATKAPVKTVKLYYTKDGTAVPVTWMPIAAFNYSDYPGLYFWRVPAVSIKKTKCKVKVVLKDANGVIVGSDASDSYFTIRVAAAP